MGILRQIITFIGILFILAVALAAIFFVVAALNAKTLDAVVQNGIYALIAIAIVTLLGILANLERIVGIQANLLEEAEEQSQLLRYLAKAARGDKPTG